MKNFKLQVVSTEIISWENEEEGMDKYEVYERRKIGLDIIYVNTFNRTMIFSKEDPLFITLEEKYKELIKW